MMDTSTFENKFAAFAIDGQTRSVCYSFNSLCEMEDFAGCNLIVGMESLVSLYSGGGGDGPTGKQLRGLLAAWIVPFPTWPADELAKQLDYAGQMIRIDTADSIKIALFEACTLAVSEELGLKFREAVEKAAEAVRQRLNKLAPSVNPPVDGAPAVPVEAAA